MSAAPDRQLPPDHNHYETPRALFRLLDREFDFDVDAYASATNRRCPLFIDEARDALATPWTWDTFEVTTASDFGPTVFANPPHSNPEMGHAVERMAEQSETHGIVVVGLVRPSLSTRWWHGTVMRWASEVRIFTSRLAYEYNGNPIRGDRQDSILIVFRPGVYGPQWTTMRPR
ncbi:MAG: hypothetical protein GTO30_03370 [Acidobacteria bacterium]|nr:hypothetical protein [Acidobacteriota bacterium]NIQ84440.1 hypothetical protein [Acidobacteriota bacterium]